MLKFALIGCGRIAQRHSELLGLGKIPGACLQAVCDIDKKKARIIGEKYAASFYTNYNEMMSKENIDAVVILTESGNHAKHAIEVAQYGKHIIVEKPMALTIDDADKMILECAKNKCKLFVIKQNRFNLPVLKLKEALDAKRFGKLVLGTVRVRWCRTMDYYNLSSWRGTWAMDGGVITNQACHHVDLLEWMMGDVDSVYAKGIHGLSDIEVEDTAAVVVKFRNGALGIIEATTATRPKDIEGSISILGEKGTVEIGGFAVNKLLHWNFTDKEPEDKEVFSEYSENPPNVYGFGHQAYYKHVVDCITNDKAPLVDGLEGRKTVELISAIYESMETRKEVFLRFKPEKCKLGQRL